MKKTENTLNQPKKFCKKGENYNLFELPGRKAWRETKILKAETRELRYHQKLLAMQQKYTKLRTAELKVLSDGRKDFDTDEIYEMLYDAYFDARPGKRGTYDVQRVETNLFDNLYELAVDIAERKYHPLRSEAFIVFDPVVREIFAASFRDRIVHHLLVNICINWWNRHFVRDSYSCRIGKGTDYGVRRAARHIAVQSQNYSRSTYFVKMDIKGFFMSMDRKLLEEMAVAGVHQQFRNFGPLGRLAVYLWRQIIRDDPLDGVRIRGHRQDWDSLPKDKSLFFQEEGKGVVIGNITSQLLSNIFLDGLDKFIIYQLDYKHYGRYVDDFYVVVTEDELTKVEKDIERIRGYLMAQGLTMHPKKTKFLDVKNGVSYLGHYIQQGHIEMDRRYQKKYYEALTEVGRTAKSFETLASYMGGCVNYGCRKMQQKIWRRAGQEFEI